MTVVFFLTILFDEVRPKVLCIHTKLIIVCRRLGAVSKERDCSYSIGLSCLLREQ